jgi:pimeloyl-ACP methyl ester carboxylesterase
MLARPFVGQYLMKRIARKRMPAWYQLSVGNKCKLDRFCSCAEESFRQGALWSLASAYQIYMDPGVELAVPGQPILAIWGLADRSHPPENADSPKKLSGNVTYHALADCGHCPELEDPQSILRLVRAFVADAPECRLHCLPITPGR